MTALIAATHCDTPAREPDNAFGRLLRTYRERRGMTQWRLAAQAGCEHSTVSRWESGSRNPTRESIALLVDVLRLDPRDRDALLIAAGFAPSDPGSMFAGEPIITELAAVLRDEAVPEAVRDDVRAWVRATVRMAQRTAVAS